MNIVIFDLDGCVADDRHRRHLLPQDPQGDYSAYHERCGEDPVINKELVQKHAHEMILFITARPDPVHGQTMDWIIRHFADCGIRFSLLMRPAGNRDSSPALKVGLFEASGCAWSKVAAIYDDRQDVLDAYERCCGVKGTLVGGALSISVPSVLRSMAATYEERNAVYGDNYKMVGQIMKVLFPKGIPPEILHSDHWHLFELKIVKLTRFAISGLEHADSIHDDAVYSAMIETILKQKGIR